MVVASASDWGRVVTPAQNGLGRRRRVYEPAPEPGTGRGDSEGLSCCAGVDSGPGAGATLRGWGVVCVRLWGRGIGRHGVGRGVRARGGRTARRREGAG